MTMGLLSNQLSIKNSGDSKCGGIFPKPGSGMGKSPQNRKV
jgi:hypothetical protein